MFFKRDYKTYLTSELLNTADGEIEINLNTNTSSDTGYILINPGTEDEDSIYYHRSSGNRVWCYGVNRTNPTAQAINTSVLLVNSIDAMNYLARNAQDQFYVFKKSTTELIIKGGSAFEGGVLLTVVDVDTSDGTPTQVLINDKTNYVYIEDGVIVITETYDNNKYIIAEIDVSLGGNVDDIRNQKPFSFKGLTGDTGIQGQQGIQGIPGNDGNDGTNGTTLIHGAVDPTTEGSGGDFYVNTTSMQIFGPKTLEDWGTGTNIKGDPGNDGADGIDGLDGGIGPTGLQIINGTIDPTTEGRDGDFYLNTVTHTMFGPKVAGVWGTGVVLASEITIGTVTTVDPTADATVTNSGTAQNPVLDIEIPKGETGDIGEPGSPGETLTTTDNQQTSNNPEFDSIDLSVGVHIKLLNIDGSYTEYTATTIKNFDSDGDLSGVPETGLSGSWAGNNINYTGYAIQTVNGDTGALTINGNLAYINASNIFLKNNTFTKTTTFTGPAVFKVVSNTVNDGTIDFSKSTKRYVSTTGDITINGTNLVNGTTLLLAVHNNSLPTVDINLTLGTFTNVDGIKTYGKYIIGSDVHPIVIPSGVNMLVMEVFSSGIHISHAGVSNFISA